ncbi:hypothetical protein ACQR3P_31835 [Rhodococcus sp. IEGM1300]
MLEVIQAVMSGISTFYTSTDWGHASEFMSFVRETVEMFVFVVGLQDANDGKEKDE